MARRDRHFIVMKNANPKTNIIFKSNDQFAFTVYDANGNKIEPTEFGKYDENGVWHKETNIDKAL